MPREYLNIGSSPPEEDCVQLDHENPNYLSQQRVECTAYIEALRKKLGPEPEGAQLGIKREAHDFGPYYEVVCYYDEDNEPAMEYAFKCEGDGPMTWAEVGMTKPEFDT